MHTAPLHHAFPPEFRGFSERVRGPQPDAVPVTALLQPGAVGGLVARYGAALSSGDRRAVLSMWSQHYFLSFIPAVVAGILVAAQPWDVVLDRSAVMLSDVGEPVAVCVPELPRPGEPAGPLDRLTSLLRTHLEPLAAALQEAGLAAPVVWSNAGAVLAWTLQTVVVPQAAVAPLSGRLQQPTWDDGRANPLAAAVQSGLRDGSRAVCCLRHRLPGTARCASCPVSCRASGPPSGSSSDPSSGLASCRASCRATADR
ncbi:MAG: siderophore-iron reductase FhuF [Janthinobacterium lividum]